MPSKKFAYGRGDEEDTDAFITSTISAAPQNADQMELQTGNFASSRDGSYYAVDNNGGRKEFRNNCARIIVFLFSAILILVGIGFITGGALEKKNGGLLPICPNCDKIITAAFAIGGIVLAFGLVGFWAAQSRSSFLSCIFIVVLVILSLLFLGVGIGFLVIQGGTHLDDIWKAAVKNDPDAICNVQQNLKCSGYNFCCYSGNTTTTTAPVTTATGVPTQTTAALLAADDSIVSYGEDNLVGDNASTAAPAASPACALLDPSSADAAAYCVPSCYSNAQPCGAVLKKDLKKLTIPVAAVAFPLGVLCGLVAWASKRMLTKEE